MFSVLFNYIRKNISNKEAKEINRKARGSFLVRLRAMKHMPAEFIHEKNFCHCLRTKGAEVAVYREGSILLLAEYRSEVQIKTFHGNFNAYHRPSRFQLISFLHFMSTLFVCFTERRRRIFLSPTGCHGDCFLQLLRLLITVIREMFFDKQNE